MIACITFTNIAADEIKQRAKHKNLEVSTIHDFLWSSIKNYQNDLKKSLVALIKQEIAEEKSVYICLLKYHTATDRY
jgi:DNA helicase-2/ATP-dependent DNA helicase PcrA